MADEITPPSTMKFPRNVPAWNLVTAVALFGAAVSPLAAATLSYPDFSSVAGLQLNGSAAQAGNRLRLTESTSSQSGSAFSQTAVTLTSDVSFSSFFSFNISLPAGIGDGDGPGADGLAFVVQTVSNSVGSAGGGIGYQGISNSVAVEFDTYDNGEISGNHVGVGLNGNTNTVATANHPTRFNDGANWFAWVDYNGATDLLEVRVSSNSSRPAGAFLSHTVDLTGILGTTNAFVGFTAATGAGYGRHEILAWEFRDTYNPVVTPPQAGVPETGSSALLLLAGLASLAAFRRRSARD